jgi:hypothetical protein
MAKSLEIILLMPLSVSEVNSELIYLRLDNENSTSIQIDLGERLVFLKHWASVRALVSKKKHQLHFMSISGNLCFRNYPQLPANN